MTRGALALLQRIYSCDNKPVHWMAVSKGGHVYALNPFLSKQTPLTNTHCLENLLLMIIAFSFKPSLNWQRLGWRYSIYNLQAEEMF